MRKQTKVKRSFEEFFEEQKRKSLKDEDENNDDSYKINAFKRKVSQDKIQDLYLKSKCTLRKEAREQLQKERPMLKKQHAKLNGLLRVQLVVSVLLLGALLGCACYRPATLEMLRQPYQMLFEGSDYAPSLLRFTQRAVEVLAIEAWAEKPPIGSSLSVYQTDEVVVCPVQNYIVSSPYGWRNHPFGGDWSFHNGIDLACVEGEPVCAAIGGVVERNYLSDSYGNCICIRHADGTVTLYAHMQYAFARVGEVVCAGTQIGTVGQTGVATGAHLHFEVIVNGERQDPSEMIGAS